MVYIKIYADDSNASSRFGDTVSFRELGLRNGLLTAMLEAVSLQSTKRPHWVWIEVQWRACGSQCSEGLAAGHVPARASGDRSRTSKCRTRCDEALIPGSLVDGSPASVGGWFGSRGLDGPSVRVDDESRQTTR